MSNANDMAFPVVLEWTRTPNDSEQLGLTKREYFAAMAMQGLLSHLPPTNEVFRDAQLRAFASRSVLAADALLAELEKEPQS